MNVPVASDAPQSEIRTARQSCNRTVASAPFGVSPRYRDPRISGTRVAWLRCDGAQWLKTLRQADFEVFLFDARSGHCEYYSTAMAVMLRSLGVPTRWPWICSGLA